MATTQVTTTPLMPCVTFTRSKYTPCLLYSSPFCPRLCPDFNNVLAFCFTLNSARPLYSTRNCRTGNASYVSR